MIWIESVVVVQEDVFFFRWLCGEYDLGMTEGPSTARKTHDDDEDGQIKSRGGY